MGHQHWVGLTLLLAACNGNGNGANDEGMLPLPPLNGGHEYPCQLNSQCGLGEVCAEGACVPADAGGGGGIGEAGASGGSVGGAGSGGAGSGGAPELAACSGVVCDSPPASDCESPSSFKTYDTVGTCEDGVCSYAYQTIDCYCQDGACRTDPCLATCPAPPQPDCKNANTLTTYAASDTCVAGVCSYVVTDHTCTFGCSSDACNPDPCEAVVCLTPPAARCKNPSTAISYAANGTCSEGVCSYVPTEVACDHGCAVGQCLPEPPEPCEGVVCSAPPAAKCETLDKLTTYAASGTCSQNVCSYPASTQTCPVRCSNAACAGPYCDDQAPATLPFVVTSAFYASQWNFDFTQIQATTTVDFCMGRSPGCSRWKYTPNTAGAGPAGVLWSTRADANFTHDSICLPATVGSLTFEARGAVGGEVVTFGVPDGEMKTLTLTTTWTVYSLEVTVAALNDPQTGLTEAFFWEIHPATPAQAIQFAVSDIKLTQ